MRRKKTKLGVEIRQTYGMADRTTPTLWIVVGNRGRAQVFEMRSGGGSPKNPKVVQDFPFPKGRRKGSDLVTDRPGRSTDSYTRSSGGHQTGSPRHAMSGRTSLENQMMNELSQKVGDYLDTARKGKKFDELLLIAEPRFLGSLKSHFSRPLERLVKDTIEKDLAWLEGPKLKSRLMLYIQESALASGV